MNQLKTLTTERKIMNMVKLGIVSRLGSYFQTFILISKYKDMDRTPYTLCAIQVGLF